MKEPGQARLVVSAFGLITPIKELDEIIERTRQEKDLPSGDWKEKKERLRILLSIRDGIEPCCSGISELAHDGKMGELLRAHREAARRDREAGTCDGRAKSRPNRTRIRNG